MILNIVGIIFPWFIVGLGCWIGYHLIRQNGRILLHLEALEKQLAQLSPTPVPRTVPRTAPSQPQGLPVGSVAPAFTLPDLAGEQKTLAHWRGQCLLLIFFNPNCGFCRQMAPDLATVPVAGTNGYPLPLVITTGEVEANRKLVAEYGLRCPVLRQEQREVAAQYQAHGTPMGYLIDEQGNIASPLAVGAQALLALAGAPNQGYVEASTSHNGHKVHKGNRSLSESRINRSGLKAGTPAPAFTLPRIDGGEVSLEEYQGRRVLLVFSDPQCGPCDLLSPQLEQLHRRTPEVQVVMISRRGVEENRQKVQKHGLTFPVVLQNAWEISRQYAMFGTPIGYLIDEEGIIAADVAVGVEPILALLSGKEPSTGIQGNGAGVLNTTTT
jgi:peroxiredoxin